MGRVREAGHGVAILHIAETAAGVRQKGLLIAFQRQAPITAPCRSHRFQCKRRLHPIDILIEFSGFAVGALTCEYPS